MQMNPMSIIRTMMGQMKVKNPQGYQFVNSLMQNNGNPQALVQQIMKNATPQQRENLFKQCKQYNVPDNVLSQLQNMK